MINWSAIQQLTESQATLHTKRSEPFHIVAVRNNTVLIKPQTGQQYTINRDSLEKAVAYIQRGGTIAGPGEYKTKIADDRPSYAWAILRHLEHL